MIRSFVYMSLFLYNFALLPWPIRVWMRTGDAFVGLAALLFEIIATALVLSIIFVALDAIDKIRSRHHA